MSDHDPQEQEAPVNREELVNDTLAKAKEFLQVSLQDQLQGQPGVPSTFESLKLAKREVVVQQSSCGAGHIHRNISLVETFSLAGAAEGEAVTDLDAALAEFKTKALETPQDGEELVEYTDGPGFYGKPDGSEILRTVTISDAFETAASKAAPQEPQQGQTLSIEDIMRMMSGGRKPGGPGGLN